MQWHIKVTNWYFFMLPPSQLVVFHVTTLTTGLFSLGSSYVNVHIRPSFSGEIYKQTSCEGDNMKKTSCEGGNMKKDQLWGW